MAPIHQECGRNQRSWFDNAFGGSASTQDGHQEHRRHGLEQDYHDHVLVKVEVQHLTELVEIEALKCMITVAKMVDMGKDGHDQKFGEGWKLWHDQCNWAQ